MGSHRHAGTVTTVVGVAFALVSAWELRQFILNYRISINLRNQRVKSVAEAVEADNKEYIVVSGVVAPVKKEEVLHTPIANVACVLYSSRMIRMVEQLKKTAKTVSSSTTVDNSPNALQAIIKASPAYKKTLGGRVEKKSEVGSHSLGSDTLASNDDAISWCLKDKQGDSHYIMLDLEHNIKDDNIFYLDVVHESFEADKKSVKANSLTRTIGYKRKEECLRVNKQLLVCGELIKEDGIAKLRMARAKDFFDTKTQRLKPYIISVQNLDSLLIYIEKQGRRQLAISICTALISTGCFLSAILRRRY